MWTYTSCALHTVQIQPTTFEKQQTLYVMIIVIIIIVTAVNKTTQTKLKLP